MHGVDTFRHGTPVQVRLQKSLFDALERWRGKQGIIPSRPEAIRELVRKSLVESVPDDVECCLAHTAA